MKSLSCLILLHILICGCKPSQIPQRFPGNSLVNVASGDLRRDVYELVMSSEKSIAPKCKQPKVIRTVVVSRPDTFANEPKTSFIQGKWVERWTVNRCGREVNYRVDFDARGSAGTRISASLENPDARHPTPAPR